MNNISTKCSALENIIFYISEEQIQSIVNKTINRSLNQGELFIICETLREALELVVENAVINTVKILESLPNTKSL
jgi:mannose/fructose/N-acetylgalactosamine-specific phosphotransferase system component IIB